MSNLIDRVALIEDIKRKQSSGFPANENLPLYAISCLNHAPVVDAVEVRHGEWIDTSAINGYGQCVCECSICGKHEVATRDKKYCPNCGALMGKKKEGEEC